MTGQNTLKFRPRALDLYCGGGGASKGLHNAGFDVVGVDIEFRKNYPYPMIVCDALMIERVVRLNWFHFIWASPPCQKFSKATPKRCRDGHPDYIDPTRQILARSGALTCMENVPAAPLRADIILDGIYFGLPLERRRIFEANFDTSSLQVGPRTRRQAGPASAWHTGPSAGQVGSPDSGELAGPSFGPVIDRETGPATRPALGLPKAVCVTGGGGPDKGTLEEWKAAMEIDWMTRRELVEAVPPAYSEAIGRCAIEALQAQAMAAE